METNNRFQLLSEEDLAALSENSSNKNTKRSTNTWLNVYKNWASIRGKSSLLDYEPNELDGILCQFYGEVRKKDGSDYEPE